MSQIESSAEIARKRQADADAARVIRMLAMKAAIFVAVPAVVAAIVVWLALG